jgi:2-phospho-L-lactate guanylyltransferase
MREASQLHPAKNGGAGMILIPVKGFTTAKQRLTPVLNGEERSILARAMLEDVLRALADCSDRSPAALITSDPDAREAAARYGFGIIDDRKASGETGAVAIAARDCIERGVTSILVIPGDVPLVTAGEVCAVLEALPAPNDEPGVVLVPAHDGRGTNAALLRPPGLFGLCFGNDSFEPHLRAAQEATPLCKVLELPGIGLDVDNPADLERLLRVETRTQSQMLLYAWNVPDRLLALRGGKESV